MSRSTLLAALLVLACRSSNVPGSGTNLGNGQCAFPPLIGKQVTEVCLPPGGMNGCGEPLCGAAPGMPAPRVGLAFPSTADNESIMCRTSYGDDYFNTTQLDPAGQLTSNRSSKLFSACKFLDRCRTNESCSFFQAAPETCGALAFLDGFVITPASVDNSPPTFAQTYFKRPLGGNSHDGDQDMNMSPFAMGIQGRGTDATLQQTVDIRGFGTDSNMHIEMPWCRWYGAPISIPADTIGHQEVNFCSFRPDSSERMSVVGDWIVDGEHTEIHDARFLVAVRADRSGTDRCSTSTCMDGVAQGNCLGMAMTSVTCADPTTPGCGNKNLWHLLASGFFAQDTAQQDRLFIKVPIPPAIQNPSPPLLDHLKFDIPSLSVTSGCLAEGLSPVVDCTTVPGACTIDIARNSATASERSCAAHDVCPCSNRTDTSFGQCGSSTWSQVDLCHPKSSSSEIAFARDIRVEWVDPYDAWVCSCELEDPSTPGTPLRAPIQGCAPPGLADDEQEEIEEACEVVCGGSPVIGGGAPAFRYGAGRMGAPDATTGFMLARNACEELSPASRPSPTGDYLVDLTHSTSVIEVGEVDGSGNFSRKATTQVLGQVYLNLGAGGSQVTLSSLRATADDFIINGFLGIDRVELTNNTVVMLNRATGTRQPAGHFEIPAFHLQASIETTVDRRARGTSVLFNEGPLTLMLAANGDFALDGSGQTEDHKAVVFHLRGRTTNHPPTAMIGGASTFECDGNHEARVTLDGLGSTDPDPGDGVEHYQWFEGVIGRGNAATLEADLALGGHDLSLHVYDSKLGSSMASRHVQVVDATPPALSLASDVLCLWPPNHRYALLRLGQEIRVAASDRCDAVQPVVRIVSVISNEAADATGSGSTHPDVVAGPTAACIRAERAGPGEARSYTVVVGAADQSGNETLRALTVVVPHDLSTIKGCAQAEGIDEPDTRCER